MKRLILATDLRRGSVNAVARALELAGCAGASIRAVHVGPPGSSAERPARARAAISRLVHEIADEGLHARASRLSIRTPAGEPAQEILDEAEKFDADLIVMGAHGEPRFRDVLFGTTATHVARHGSRPILIVQNDGTVPYRRVMAAIDSPETAEPLFALVGEVAPNAEIFGVHIFDPTLRQLFAGHEALEQEVARREGQLQTMIEAAVENCSKRVSTKQHAVVETGEVLDVLTREADVLQPDLVAMGTRRSSGYLGSYAVDTLFWCSGDVLILPERSGKSAAGA